MAIICCRSVLIRNVSETRHHPRIVEKTGEFVPNSCIMCMSTRTLAKLQHAATRIGVAYRCSDKGTSTSASEVG